MKKNLRDINIAYHPAANLRAPPLTHAVAVHGISFGTEEVRLTHVAFICIVRGMELVSFWVDKPKVSVPS